MGAAGASALKPLGPGGGGAALALAFFAALAGCAHRAPRPAAAARAAPGAPLARLRPASSDENPGVFHTVKPGETLYRIARTYEVPEEVVAQENAIDDPTKLEVGVRLFIPGAQEEREVPPVGAPLAVARAGELEPAPPLVRAPQRPRVAARAVPRPLPRVEKAAARGALEWPVHGVLFSPFGPRARDQHDGIDLAAPEGTPVRAAEAGRVLFVGEQRGYGRLILIGHAGDLVTVYAHNQRNLVEVGQEVERGAVIARVGRSGNATGPHLHFEVRVSARPQNPMRFLR